MAEWPGEIGRVRAVCSEESGKSKLTLKVKKGRGGRNSQVMEATKRREETRGIQSGRVANLDRPGCLFLIATLPAMENTLTRTFAVQDDNEIREARSTLKSLSQSARGNTRRRTTDQLAIKQLPVTLTLFSIGYETGLSTFGCTLRLSHDAMSTDRTGCCVHNFPAITAALLRSTKLESVASRVEQPSVIPLSVPGRFRDAVLQGGSGRSVGAVRDTDEIRHAGRPQRVISPWLVCRVLWGTVKLRERIDS